MNNITFSVFTKPWPDKSVHELGEWVKSLGFDGIELPVRPGYQVTPETVATLEHTARILRDCGVRIFSVAGSTDEATIAACARAGVPVIRVMARVAKGERYTDTESRLRAEYDALVPLLDKYGVKLGVQNHCGRFVANAVGLRRIIENYDPKHIGMVWDAAHEALEGSDPDLALDVAWPYLCMVNLKNAVRQRVDAPDALFAQWKVTWVAGNEGYAQWPDVIKILKRRQYDGVVCLTAEYSDHDAVDRLIREDLVWAKSLFEERG